jgi:hypothetical protein
VEQASTIPTAGPGHSREDSFVALLLIAPASKGLEPPTNPKQFKFAAGGGLTVVVRQSSLLRLRRRAA